MEMEPVSLQHQQQQLLQQQVKCKSQVSSRSKLRLKRAVKLKDNAQVSYKCLLERKAHSLQWCLLSCRQVCMFSPYVPFS